MKVNELINKDKKKNSSEQLCKLVRNPFKRVPNSRPMKHDLSPNKQKQPAHCQLST